MRATLNSISHDLDVESAIVIPYRGDDSEEESISEENIIEADNFGLEVA
jgi:hypothetical protein